jgi:hypothetical protein
MSNNGFNRLGYFSLAAQNGAFALGYLLAPSIVKRIGVKLSLITGSFCEFLWIIC